MSKDGNPVILKNTVIDDPEKFILDFFLEVNPRVHALLSKYKYKYKLGLKNLRVNTAPNDVLRYNTIVEVHPDGCLFRDGLNEHVIFSYGRWDISRLAFRETGTIGVPDVPFQVKANTEEGVKKAFYGILDNLIFVGDHPQYPDVKEWRGYVNPDNLVAIYTKWEGDTRVYLNEFVIFSKAYNPDGAFEDSDFVE